MNITVIGTGNMGSAFVQQLSRAGHKIRVTGRDMSKAEMLAQGHDGVTAVSAKEAVGPSEIVILATSYGDALPALRGLGDLAGKVVIDITNPLNAEYSGLVIGHETSAAEEISKAIPGIKVIKAFNTLFAQVLADGPKFASGQIAPVFFAGDNENAKQIVRNLIDSLGFKAVDAGPLKNARYLEPLAGLNIYFGYGAGWGTAIAPAWIAKTN
jgi:8-hydroxy-5-deazaflavin:NADPH oxidoreductase